MPRHFAATPSLDHKRPGSAQRRRTPTWGVRALCCAVAVAVLCGSLAPGSWGQTPPPIAMEMPGQISPSEELTAALDRRGNLTLRGTSLEAALFTINELWGVNIVAGEVSGRVNGVFKDAPLKEILDTILLGNGYAYRLVGESIVVSPMAQVGTINPYFISVAVPLHNVSPSEVVAAVSLLSTPQGKVQAVDAARSLIVVDFPERVKMIRELAASIDAASGAQPGAYDASGRPKQLEAGYFHTQYIRIAEAKRVLATVLSPMGRVESIEGDDRLVIVDFAENLQMANRVLQQVDRPRPQVQITALIYDLSLEDIEQIGVNWAHAVHGSVSDPTSASYFRADSMMQQPFGPNDTGGTFTFMNLSTHFDLRAVVLAVQNATDSRLLANPNVTVMDNQKANFQAITQIPYQQITQTDAGGQLAGTAFKDAGIKLDVMPKIAADGTIEMTVRPEFSRLTGFSPGDNQPIIDTRSAETTVRVVNGQTLVIGGMRQRSDVGDFSGVPGAKDVRVLGHLFRARSTNIRESELVVFITPHIVGYGDPLDCRDQKVLDTIDARLNAIPQAEGYPPVLSGGEGSGCYEGPTPVPTVPEEVPAFPTEARGVVPPGEATLNPAYASLPIRRLPPVDQQPEVEPPWRLRPDYDARFRATGGIHSADQRLVERRPEPRTEYLEAKRQEESKSESFWQKLWKR